MRRPQTRDAATLLIQHQNCLRRQGSTQCGDQGCELPWIFDVAREQDHADGRAFPEQRDFVRGQRRPGDTDDGGFQKSAIEQPAPLARTRSQNAVA
jgi:hypothetical protein